MSCTEGLRKDTRSETINHLEKHSSEMAPETKDHAGFLKKRSFENRPIKPKYKKKERGEMPWSRSKRGKNAKNTERKPAKGAQRMRYILRKKSTDIRIWGGDSAWKAPC